MFYISPVGLTTAVETPRSSVGCWLLQVSAPEDRVEGWAINVCPQHKHTAMRSRLHGA